MGGIFVSYRRSDSQGEAGRLFDDLVKHFGEHLVFMDVAAIEAGRDFRKAIEEGVVKCGALLVVMGPEWVTAKDETGARRLDDPGDFVRIETAAALRRDIPVIPVLVRGAQMARADQLPDELKELSYRNCVELTHARWRSDVQLLIEALRRLLGEPGTADANLRKPPSGINFEAESGSAHGRQAEPSLLGPDAIAPVIRDLTVYIGPIAAVVVKRAAAQSSSVEEVCRKVAEEIDSAEAREKFLSQHHLPASKAQMARAKVEVPPPPVSVQESLTSPEITAPRGQATSSRRNFLIAGIISVLLIGAIFGWRLTQSRREGSAEAPSRSARESIKTPAADESQRGPVETSPAPAILPLAAPAASKAEATAPARPQPASISQEVAHALLLKEVVPAYPPLARQARVHGTVVFEVVISKDGAVDELHTVSGHPLLIPAAVDAVKQWRYKPYVVNGEAVPVKTQIAVVFTMTPAR